MASPLLCPESPAVCFSEKRAEECNPEMWCLGGKEVVLFFTAASCFFSDTLTYFSFFLCLSDFMPPSNNFATLKSHHSHGVQTQTHRNSLIIASFASNNESLSPFCCLLAVIDWLAFILKPQVAQIDWLSFYHSHKYVYHMPCVITQMCLCTFLLVNLPFRQDTNTNKNTSSLGICYLLSEL